MKTSCHFSQRLNQRGITKEMVDFTLEFGDIDSDKFVTNKKLLEAYIKEYKYKSESLSRLFKKFKHLAVAKLIRRLLEVVRKNLSTALRLRDKGGIVVIYDNNTLVTVYDTDSYCEY